MNISNKEPINNCEHDFKSNIIFNNHTIYECVKCNIIWVKQLKRRTIL